MEIEPKRKRRWFQFSLRTLMIGVTLLAVACGYVGWEAKIVKEREEFLENQQHYMGPNPFDEENGDLSVPWILSILGAEADLYDRCLQPSRCRAQRPCSQRPKLSTVPYKTTSSVSCGRIDQRI